MSRIVAVWVLILMSILTMAGASPSYACTPTPQGIPPAPFADRVTSTNTIFEAVVIGQFLVARGGADVAIVVRAIRYFKGNGPSLLAIEGWGSGALCLDLPPPVGDHQIFFTFDASNGGIVGANYFGGPTLPANEQSAADIIAVTNQQPTVPTNGGSTQPIPLFGLTSLADSPDGQTILSSGWDEKPRLWDAKTGQVLFSLQGHTASVQSTAYSPDGQIIITGGGDTTARLWDAKSGKSLLTLQHSDLVSSVAFSRDSQMVLTGSWDRTARLWEAKTGKLLFTLKHDQPVWTAMFSPDGQSVLTAGGSKPVTLWDVRSGQVRLIIEGTTHVTSAAFSLDGQRIVTGDSQGTISLWDAHSGAFVRRLQDYGPAAWSVAFSPDSRSVLVGSEDKTAKLWDAQTGQLHFTVQGHSQAVRAVTFSPDGQTFMTASLDGLIKMWDARTGQQSGQFPKP